MMIKILILIPFNCKDYQRVVMTHYDNLFNVQVEYETIDAGKNLLYIPKDNSFDLCIFLWELILLREKTILKIVKKFNSGSNVIRFYSVDRLNIKSFAFKSILHLDLILLNVNYKDSHKTFLMLKRVEVESAMNILGVKQEMARIGAVNKGSIPILSMMDSRNVDLGIDFYLMVLNIIFLYKNCLVAYQKMLRPEYRRHLIKKYLP